MPKKQKVTTEFKEFISRGNVVDLAVGVIIGAAFTAIVNSLVADLVSPLIQFILQSLIGSKDFSGLQFTAGGAIFTYGNFVMAIINFLLVAFVLFLLVRTINHYRRQKDTPPDVKHICPYCRTPVDRMATKCPNCTADMTPEQVK